MKEEKGKKGTNDYYYKEMTEEEMQCEQEHGKAVGKMVLSGIITSISIICLTILIYKSMCTGGSC